MSRIPLLLVVVLCVVTGCGSPRSQPGGVADIQIPKEVRDELSAVYEGVPRYPDSKEESRQFIYLADDLPALDVSLSTTQRVSPNDKFVSAMEQAGWKLLNMMPEGAAEVYGKEAYLLKIEGGNPLHVYVFRKPN